MRPGPRGYGAGMATIRENHRGDEEFHEETPQEFAAGEDRTFTKVAAPGSESEESEGDTEEKEQRDSKATGDE